MGQLSSSTISITNDCVWHYLPVTTSWQRPKSYPPTVKRILLPVQCGQMTDMVVTSVLDFAAKLKMDLVLLVVCEENSYDQEVLFSSLRGFQALAQQFSKVSFWMDTAVGFNDQTISQHADRYQVDVVILANQFAKFESSKQELFAPYTAHWEPLV